MNVSYLVDCNEEQYAIDLFALEALLHDKIKKNWNKMLPTVKIELLTCRLSV